MLMSRIERNPGGWARWSRICCCYPPDAQRPLIISEAAHERRAGGRPVDGIGRCAVFGPPRTSNIPATACLATVIVLNGTAEFHASALRASSSCCIARSGTDEIERRLRGHGLARVSKADAERALPAFDPMLVAVADDATAALRTRRARTRSRRTVAAKIEARPLATWAEAIATALKMSAHAPAPPSRRKASATRVSSIARDAQWIAKTLFSEPTRARRGRHRVGFSDPRRLAALSLDRCSPGTFWRLRSAPPGRTSGGPAS